MDNSTTNTPNRYRVTQVITYVPGTEFFLTENTISNKLNSTLCLDVFTAADIFLASSDSGYGYYNSTAGAVGGSSSLTHEYNIFTQAKAGSLAATSFQEGYYSTIWTNIGIGIHFNNSIQAESYMDNGAGLEWRNVCIPPFGTANISYYWAFGPVYAINPPCVCITNKSVDCISTNGTYAWSFCMTNTWTNAIQYLSFPDLPAGVAINRDIVALNPVLQPGQGTCLTLYITNRLGPTNICFSLGVGATNFFNCCEITNCLTLAPCCAYVTNESTAAISGQGDCYTYSLKIKNVSPISVSYIFFTPDPYSSCLTFTPDIIHLATPILPNQTAIVTPALKVCIDRTCPMPLCFLVSLHNSNMVQCCSTRHCPTNLTSRPIALASPADGSVFLASTNIPLAVDLNGEIEFSTVAYRANDQVIATDSGPVFSAVWSNAPVGSYVLRAEGVEKGEGSVWVSDAVMIYVVTNKSDSMALGAPVLTSATVRSGGLSFTLRTVAGVTYEVECSESMVSPNWQVVQTVVGNGGSVVVNCFCTDAPQKFYRVRVQ